MTTQKSMSINKINRQLQHNPIAIIGMASLFPQARNIQEYWRNIVNKTDCITEVPSTHWSIEDYYDPNPRTPEDKTYCKKGGFLPYVDFNPMEFGLPPNNLEVTDVSQLLSLVVAKEAMEDAGYGAEREFNRAAAGVILGVAQGKQLAMPLAARLEYPVWEKVLKSSGLSDEDTQKIVEKIKSTYVKWDENAFPGMLANVVAGRIANRLDLGGINCVVDAACASSFAALKMAVSELLEHRSDMMLTGGVDTDNTIMAYISFSKTPAVTPSENVKPFDAKSDGMMLGEGIGMVVLKRLEDAQRDNDQIYAVIKGIGTSSDGRYKSIYAPRKEGQIAALKRAYEDAGFSPASVGLVEAHGTGTMAGDPTEFGSLKDFFSEQDAKNQHIALGSVKSQIGHTKAAAGAASLIKTVLALHHKILPPTINVTEPNPKLNIKNSPFYLNTETRPWIRAEGEPPRRAGVSSFGFGGTNYHIVLEEYQTEQSRPYRLHNAPAELLLFAETPAQLVSRCEEILTQLQSEAKDKHFAQLIEECKSTEIPQTAARVGFVADSPTQASKLLQITIDLLKNKRSSPAWEHPQGIFYRASGMELSGKVVALFSGQGSQYLDMGRELVMNFPELRQMYGYMDSLLLKDNLQPLSEIVFPHPVFEEAEKNAQVAALQRTEYAQPAIGMLSAGLYKILQKAGFNADFIAGHSFGELTALWASGVLSDEDFCFLVKARGQAMAAPQDPNYDTGTMLAVKEDISKVEAVLKHFPGVAIANFNSPRQIVLAGPTEDINKVRETLHQQGCAAVLLPVAAAFHTGLIAFAQKSFAIAIKNAAFSSPKTPVYTNVTGKAYPKEPQEIQNILQTHLSNSVLFKQQIENIYGAGGYCFVEFGPRRIITGLVKDILGDRPHIAIALNPSAQKNSDRALREAVVQLRVAGMSLKNLDPYQLPEPIPAKNNKGLSVRINGINYVSEKTKNAREQALQDGHQVKLLTVEPAATTVNTSVNNLDDCGVGILPAHQIPGTPIPQNHLESNGHSSNGKNLDSNTLEIIQILPEFSANSHSEITTLEPEITPVALSPQPVLQPEITPVALSPQPATKLKMQTTANKLVNYQQVLENLENVLAQFQQTQSEQLQVHGQYLSHQMEYAKTFFQLMQQQNSLFAKSESSTEAAQHKPVVMESFERSMMQFHSQHGETLRIHEQYLDNQVEYTKNFFQLIQQEYSQIIAGEVNTQPVASANSPNVVQEATAAIEELVTSVKIAEIQPEPVAKNTFTPVAEPSPKTWEKPEPATPPVAEPSLIWENKDHNRVDTATPTPYSPLPTPQSEPSPKIWESQPEPVATSPVAEPVTPAAKNGSSPDSKQVTISTDNLTVATSIPTPSATVDLVDLAKNLLAITSEKTGYPVEMLDLDMDMEADLGIDSIKRVEILGALQEMYPDLPKPNLEELAEKRTIGQIVEYLQSQNSQSVSVEIAINEVKVNIESHQTTPAANLEVSTPISEPVEVDTSEPSIDLSNLGETLLTITSEKTGYPVEMLELDMDMEADLGIDSIKRVEILGAIQEVYPNLPKPNVEELGDLRTIGQIVQYLQELVGAEKKKPQPKLDEPPVQLDCTIERRPVRLKILPAPDFLDFKLPEGHIGLITDDGSLTTSKLAESLTQRGWKVIVLSFPPSLIPQQSPLPSGIMRVNLSDLSEEHLKQQLTAIATNYGPYGGFIHLNPVFDAGTNGKISYVEQEKVIVKHVFLIAKHLKKSLNEAARYGRSCFCTVARLDGAFGLGQNVSFGPIAAGLFGLTKTLNWEWQKVFCRAIDLSRAIDAEHSASHIIAEVHDPNLYITEVGYGPVGRTTLISISEV